MSIVGNILEKLGLHKSPKKSRPTTTAHHAVRATTVSGNTRLLDDTARSLNLSQPIEANEPDNRHEPWRYRTVSISPWPRTYTA